MSTRHPSRAVALVCALLLGSCGSDSPTGPSTTPSTPGAGTPPVATPTPAPGGGGATPTPAPPNSSPSGTFGLQPAPVNGVVDLVPGAALRINAARFVDVDNDALKLIVDWGGGVREEIGCGPCRLDHVYAAEGTYQLVATVSDRRVSDARAAAEITQAFHVRVRATNAPGITSFTATPPNVPVGGSSVLAWTTTDAMSVRLDPGLGPQALNGSVGVTPAATATYTLRATDRSNRTSTAMVTVTVDGPVIGSFTATPGAIDLGQTSTLAWSGILNATACSIDNGVGSVACGGGSTGVSPSTATTYTLSATGPSGSVTATAAVAINPPVIGSFTAAPTSIALGASSTLSWSGITNATSCTINNGVGTVACGGASASVNPTSPTTYTLSVTGPAGTQTATATVGIDAPTIGTFTATPASIALGASSTLSWSGILNATSCSIDNGVGTVACGGASAAVSPSTPTTYTLTVNGPGGSQTATATVGIDAANIGTFSATPGTINVGGSSTLAWSGITNATSCSIDQGIGTVSCAGGSQSVSPATTPVTYTLTATGPGGSDSDTVTVTIAAASIGSFTATPGAIDIGGSSTLAWSGITNATSCSINQGIGSVSCAGGTQSVSPAANTTYTLSVSGPGGGTTATVTVIFKAPTIGSFTASPNPTPPNSTVTLTWSGVTNATSCSLNDRPPAALPCASGSATKNIGVLNDAVSFVATGPGGQASTLVLITHIPPTAGTISASPMTITSGQSVTLSWTASTYGATCEVDNGSGSVQVGSGTCNAGSATVTPTTTTTYRLTAYNGSGNSSTSVTVTVN